MTSQVTDNLVTFLGKCCHLSSCFDRGQLKALGLHQLGEVCTDSKQESWGLTSDGWPDLPEEVWPGCVLCWSAKVRAVVKRCLTLPRPVFSFKAAAGSESQAPSGSGPWRWDRSGPNRDLGPTRCTQEPPAHPGIAQEPRAWRLSSMGLPCCGKVPSGHVVGSFLLSSGAELPPTDQCPGGAWFSSGTQENLAHGLTLFLGAMACSMWDLSSLTRDRAHASCSGKCSLHHWTLREVPGSWLWWSLLDRALVLDVLSHQR